MASFQRPVTASANATILIYLSLFLLLLVFFIVLTAQSAPRDYRMRAVLDSVERSFAPPPANVPAGARPGADSNATGSGSPAAIARVGLQRLGDLFETELAVAKVDRVGTGRLMVVSLAVDDLFQPGTARVRSERIGLLDRISREIGTRSGVRFEVDFLIALGPEPAKAAGRGDPVAQAAGLARALIADGAPVEAISVGVEPGRDGAARFLFSARRFPETRAGGAGGDRGTP